jgi:FkbM family methyltransferase
MPSGWGGDSGGGEIMPFGINTFAKQNLAAARSLDGRDFVRYFGAQIAGSGDVSLPLAGARPYLRRRSVDLEIYSQFALNHDAFHALEAIGISHCDTFVDLGAHIGLFSLQAIATCHPGRLVAVEMEKSNFAYLKRNLAGFPNATLINKAVWSRDTRVSIRNRTGKNYSFECYEPEDGSGEIETVSVDSAIPNQGVVIAKIDIEGAEYEIFQPENVGWLSRVRGLIIETHDKKRAGCDALVRSALAAEGFTISQHGEYVVGRRA